MSERRRFFAGEGGPFLISAPWAPVSFGQRLARFRAALCSWVTIANLIKTKEIQRVSADREELITVGATI